MTDIIRGFARLDGMAGEVTARLVQAIEQETNRLPVWIKGLDLGQPLTPKDRGALLAWLVEHGRSRAAALRAIVDAAAGEAWAAGEALGTPQGGKFPEDGRPHTSPSQKSALIFRGRAWSAWSDKLSREASAAMRRALDEAMSRGATRAEAMEAIRGAAAGQRGGAQRLARTMTHDVATRAYMGAVKVRAGERLSGWRFSAVLDSRTSDLCRGLHGRIFAATDATLPVPPLHPHCRSCLLPVIEGEAVPDAGELAPAAPKEATRRAADGGRLIERGRFAGRTVKVTSERVGGRLVLRIGVSEAAR